MGTKNKRVEKNFVINFITYDTLKPELVFTKHKLKK